MLADRFEQGREGVLDSIDLLNRDLLRIGLDLESERVATNVHIQADIRLRRVVRDRIDRGA